jgi:uncharacterized protein YqiB (DUF1249 family)
MARFDLSQYATVEERLKTFWADEKNSDARIITLNHSKDSSLWIIETRIYLTAGDQANELPKTTGWASEANSDAFALERCETSSIGRALANYIYSGSKRPSREEMEKVARMDWLERAGSLGTIEELRDLYAQAKANNASQEILEGLKLYAQRFEESQTTRAGGGVSGGKVSRTGK